MLIENPDAFKSWLTAVLEPLCDADPAALAKYVYALVKKDKPLDDLRDGMIDQLDVFLQQETKPFVTLLFKTLDTHEYLKPSTSEVIAPASPTEGAQTTSAILDSPGARLDEERIARQELIKDDKADASASTRGDRKDKDVDGRSKKEGSGKQRIVLNRTTKFTPATVPKEKPAYATEQTLVKVIPDLLEDSLNEPLPTKTSKRDRKSDSDKEDRRRRQYKSRSRSRSWDRARRPANNNRPLWRNRSPPFQNSRYERRRSRSGSPPVRTPRYRNRSPPPTLDTDVPVNRSRSRSRERVPSPVPNQPRERLSRERDRQSRNRDRVDREKINERDREREGGRSRDCVSGTATPTQDSNPGESNPQQRGTTTLAGIFTPTQKKRCRDFDEKGFCMRGDLCQFDHGTDPVVLEDALSHMLAFPMTRPPLRHSAPGCISEYNPLAPDIWARNRNATGVSQYSVPPPYIPFLNPPPHGHHLVQRELIPVPIARAENVPPNSVPNLNNGNQRNPLTGAPVSTFNNNTPTVPLHPVKKKPFDFNRLGPNRHLSKTTGGNCSLELKKVPRGLNDILHLNNHFSKFGKIVNIQVCYEDDPEAALITFSSHTEANVAYKSTEAVLNNRFIKVFWHNSEQSKQENVPPGTQRMSMKDRVINNHNSVNHVSHNKVLINKENVKVNNNVQAETKNNAVFSKEDGETNLEVEKNGTDEITPVAVKEQSAVVLPDTTSKPDKQASVELAAMVKKRGEGAAKIARVLRHRTQQLLDRLLQQQKMLLHRLESGKPTDAQREVLLATIKDLQKSIEKTRKELVSAPKISMPQAKKAAFGVLKKVPRSKEETQKEILDAELDLFTKQQEGQDVSELQKRVAELKRQQLTLKPTLPVRRGASHRVSATRGRFSKSSASAKAGPFVNQSVDHRPRSFLVSGYETDELDQLMQHFTQFGEIVEHISDSTTPSLWLQFKSRKIAEQAATKGRQFNDRTLTVTWQSKSLSTQISANEKSSANPSFSNYSQHDAKTGGLQQTSEKPSEKDTINESTDDMSQMYMHSPNYSPLKWEGNFDENIPVYDSEDDEGKDYDKEEERSWRR